MTSIRTIFFAALMFSESVLAATPVFVLFDDGGEHIPEACTKESKSPTNLKKEKKFAKTAEYLGSVQTQFEDKNEAGINAWNHYFKDSKACNSALKKMTEELN